MYNIYFDKRAVKLINRKDFAETEKSLSSDAVIMLNASDDEIAGLPEMMRQNQNIHTLAVAVDDEEKALTLFGSRMKVIHAGGGIVKNREGELLGIFRRGVWDIPKGKQEPGEAIEATALREVEEETGIGHLRINGPIGITRHTYDTYGEFCLKYTHWFDMSCTGENTTVPQQEEDIAEARWMKPEDFREAMMNSFPSLQEITTLYFR